MVGLDHQLHRLIAGIGSGYSGTDSGYFLVDAGIAAGNCSETAAETPSRILQCCHRHRLSIAVLGGRTAEVVLVLRN